MNHSRTSVVVWGLSIVGIATVLATSTFADSHTPQIAVDPIGHWHVFGEKSLTFKITDADGAGLEDLNLFVELAREGSDRVSVRSVEEGDIIDEGGGTYSLSYTPSSIGGYAMLAKASHDGQLIVSKPVVFEVARDGDEGVKVEADGTEYVYQIRYNWEPGHIHANDHEPVKIVFELMRGVETDSDINWERPWTNTFDHVTGADDMTIRVVSKDGSVTEELSGSYQGRGVYEASRIFAPDEVGEELLYSVEVSFIDPANEAVVKSPEAYTLRAVAGH